MPDECDMRVALGWKGGGGVIRIGHFWSVQLTQIFEERLLLEGE